MVELVIAALHILWGYQMYRIWKKPFQGGECWEQLHESLGMAVVLAAFWLGAILI